MTRSITPHRLKSEPSCLANISQLGNAPGAIALAPPTPELDNAREPRLCRFQGTCRKGGKCRFRHTLDEGLGQGWPQLDNPSTADWETTQEKNWALDTDDNSAWGPDLQEPSKWIVDPPNADWEATSWGLDTDQNPAWGLDQQAASKSEEAGAGEQSTNWALNIDHNPAWGPDEQAASKWIQEAPDDTECAESGQVYESSGTGWLQETDDNPAWNIDPQVETNGPWTLLQKIPRRKNPGIFRGLAQLGWCAKGDECELLHVQDRSLERDPDEGRDQDPPEPSAPAPEGPCLPPQSIYHCMVQFGPGAIPQKIVPPFESLSLTISNYPAGIAHADLVELAEPYGVVKNTTFRLHPTGGGVQARIEFEEYSQAAKARANLNGFLLDEQVLHVQLDSVAPVRGSVHETGIARQVKLVWEAPSVSGWAFYSNVRAAKDESVRLNGILYGPRKITAEYRKSNQKLSFPVRLTGLPVDTNRDDLHAFCAGSSSVSLNPPNYTQSQDENILRCLADCGPVDFDVLPTDPSDLKITGFAQFHTDQAAASAVKALKGTPHDFLGKASISLQPVFRSKYDCANCPFTVIRNDLDRLRDACSAPASGCIVRYYEHPPYVHVYGGKADTVAQIAKCVQALVFGVDLPCWDPYFETRPAEEALRRLNSDGSFYVQSDKRRQVLRIWGNRDAGEKQIHRLLKRVEAKRHSLRLDGTMPALLNGGLRSLQDEYGASKILLDIRSQTIIALGDIKTEVESHLKAFAAAHSPGTGNCCLCFSAAEDFVELPCTHIYCASCFQHLLRPIPGINFSPPTCLAETQSPNLPRARCLTPIPIPSILSHLLDEEQTQLFEASFLSFVRSQSDYRFCISGCLVIYRIGIPGTIFSCPECGVDLCASCAVPVHTGLSCAEYHALGGSTESE
ncbi:hypothetical protein B0H11DRAFT_1905726 [Mycena galericulata]|nr:hypothetical protein B0H11DRAFT_1905726 [Mycena galericulata]